MAYFTSDVRAAALRHHETFGSGPFVVIDHVATPVMRYRGCATTLDHGSAYGQWGPMMVEFVQQHDSGPSAFHDMYPHGGGGEGLHHAALFVDDLNAAIEAHERDGRAVAMYAETDGGVAFAMIDAVRDYGRVIFSRGFAASFRRMPLASATVSLMFAPSRVGLLTAKVMLNRTAM